MEDGLGWSDFGGEWLVIEALGDDRQAPGCLTKRADDTEGTTAGTPLDVRNALDFRVAMLARDGVHCRWRTAQTMARTRAARTIERMR